MKKSTSKRTATSTTLAKELAATIADNFGEQVVILDVRQLTSYADFLVVATARNPPLARSLADQLGVLGRSLGSPLFASEGESTCEWLLLDFVDVIVHLFLPEVRSYFDFESLWRDAPRLVFPERPHADSA